MNWVAFLMAQCVINGFLLTLVLIRYLQVTKEKKEL